MNTEDNNLNNFTEDNETGNAEATAFETLRRARPFATPDDSVEYSTPRAALFEEITMNEVNENTIRATAPSTVRPRSKTRAVVAVAAAFAVATAGTGLYALSDNTPSAYAAVNAAVLETAALDSGQITIEVDVRSATDAGGEMGPFAFEQVYRFEGDDFVDSFATDGLNGEPFSFESMSVDGDYYFKGFAGDGEGWVRSTVDGEDSMFDEGLLGTNTDPDVDNMVALVEAADDVDKTDSEGGTTTYTATVAKADIVAIDIDDLPAGLAMIAEEPENLPEELAMTMVVVDGALRTSSFEAVGDLVIEGEPNFIDATVTTTYTEMGEPQNIEAPPADQIVEAPDMEMPEGFGEAIDVLDDLEERRPGLCDGAFDTMMPDEEPTDFDPAAMEEQMNEASSVYTNCLREAGEAEAAEAFISMTEGIEDGFGLEDN